MGFQGNVLQDTFHSIKCVLQTAEKWQYHVCSCLRVGAWLQSLNVSAQHTFLSDVLGGCTTAAEYWLLQGVVMMLVFDDTV